MISIISLIYKSTTYADSVYESVYEFTPLIQQGKAEFHFVANNPTQKVVQHLISKKYSFLPFYSAPKTKEELFKQGIGTPEYLHNVYKAWNFAITSANGNIIVLINSDMMFSPHWLENLIKHVTMKTYVTSKLVERIHPKYGVCFPDAYCKDFGTHPLNFQKQQFLAYCANRNSVDKTSNGGAYMPCAFQKQLLVDAGLFPEGNLHDGKSFENLRWYGDQYLMNRLRSNGVRHITALDSIVYHFKEGEMDDTI